MIAVHPGEYLNHFYIEDSGYTQNKLAEKIGISASTLSRILNCSISVTPSMAIKLQEAFQFSAEAWLAMQNKYDLYRLRNAEKENA